jgi:hypothetical protein
MRENMPGGGHRQTDGYVDRGPRKMNSFDRMGITGRVPADIADIGYDHEGNFHTDDVRYRTGQRPIGYNRPAKDEPYLDALKVFFDKWIDRVAPKPRQDLQAVKDWLNSVKFDRRSLREMAKDLGVSHQAVDQGRKRAVEQLVDTIVGGLDYKAEALTWDQRKAIVATELRHHLKVYEVDDEMLPGWVR